MSRLPMLKAIIFDFDGVICESVEVKKVAFGRLFEAYPEHLDRIIEYHMANGGISRFVKFEVIFRDILKKPLTPQMSAKLGEQFNTNAYRDVVACPLVKGAGEFLKKYSGKLKLFVISGTPEDEMEAIARDRELTQFFCKIYGSPRTKGDLCELIIRENHLKPDEIIFVGDSINDYEGAAQAGIRFIGRVHEVYPNPFEGIPRVDVVKDLRELEVLLKKENQLEEL